MLKSICGNKRLRLTEGKRSFSRLFDFYSSCSTIGSRYHMSLEAMISEARLLFPKKGFGDVNLVISHRRRININQQVQTLEIRKAAPPEYLRITASKQPGLNAPQNMILLPGVCLTAVLDGITKEGIYKNQLFRVQDWDSNSAKLVCAEGGSLTLYRLASADVI